MSTRPYLGVNVNAASVAELYQRGLIEEGEHLLALFDGVLLDENRRRVGGLALTDFVALTDSRLITWARGLFTDTVDGLPWHDVDVARTENWDPWHGRVLLAMRLPPVAPRQRRIVVQGVTQEEASDARVIVNTLDYMPIEDVAALSEMVTWVGEQVLAGVTGEALVAAFAETFPALDRPAPQAFFQVEPTPPPMEAAAPPAEPSRKRWWQRTSEQPEPAAGQTPSNLIAAYERQRQGAPAGDGAAQMAQPQPQPMPSMMPSLPDQPNMYEVSRSLRLFLEAPRKLARGIRRASEMVGGASELVNGMQDPQVRRTAMRGLYHAAAQHEAEGGPLASVGPVVRAAVRFAEPVQEEQAATPSRRIQVRPNAAAAAPSTPAQADTDSETPRAPVRRSVSVRRVEPPVEPEPEIAAPEVERSAPVEAPRIPVRRIAVGHVDAVPTPLHVNGNGHHREDV